MVEGGKENEIKAGIVCENIEESIKFYRNVLGFILPEDANKSYISIRKGNVVLGLGEMKNLRENHPVKVSSGQRIGLGVEIVLEVENIKDVYKKVIEEDYP
ncbi:MAG TPA: VOC family protein, partial [Candidatus Avamphibacillus sp.]|nr:VOC family protein [Candidatus Avamphibacillus sp.]